MFRFPFTPLATVSGFCALGLAFGCAGTPSNVHEQPLTENQAVNQSAAKTADAHDFVEIEFAPQSADLSAESRNSLDLLMKQAAQSGAVDQVLVLSWADAEYPAAGTLPKGQRELANRRNEAVKRYIKANHDVDVDTHNMAERPNTISRLLDTSDNKLKKSFLSAGLTTPSAEKSSSSKASHSVILVELE